MTISGLKNKKIVVVSIELVAIYNLAHKSILCYHTMVLLQEFLNWERGDAILLDKEAI